MKCDICNKMVDRKHDKYIKRRVRIPTTPFTVDDIVMDTFCPDCYKLLLDYNKGFTKAINDILNSKNH